MKLSNFLKLVKYKNSYGRLGFKNKLYLKGVSFSYKEACDLLDWKDINVFSVHNDISSYDRTWYGYVFEVSAKTYQKLNKIYEHKVKKY